MTSSPTDLVFVTGATGFIGATTSLHALQAGYRLRISVRKEAQIDKLKNIYAKHLDKIEFVITPDITAPDAFSGSLEGVTHILHLASPLAASTIPDEVIKPAVDGTLSILKEAAKIKTVKKVVITSSVSALMPIGGSAVVPEDFVVKEETDLDLSVSADEKYDLDNPMLKSFRIYAASKLLANQASWDFHAKEKPSFDLVTIHPTLVYGTNLIQDSLQNSGTNGYLFGSIVNGSQGFDLPLTCVHIDNVAEAHVRALDDDIKNRSYLLSGKKYTWTDVKAFAEKYYPEEAKGFKVEPNDSPKFTKTDTSRAERELGIKWTEPEVMIKEVLDQQLGFVKAGKA